MQWPRQGSLADGYFNVNVASAGGEYLLTYTASGAVETRRFDAGLSPIGGVFSLPGTTVASNGSEYLLTWSSGGNRVVSTMDTAGNLLVPAGSVLTSSAAVYDLNSSWAGTQWWTAWWSTSQGAVVARTDPSGTVLDPGGVSVDPAFGNVIREAVVAGGASGEAQVLWKDQRSGNLAPDDVRGAPVSSAGVPAVSGPLSVGAPAQVRPDLAAGAGGYAAVFESEVSGTRRVLVQRLDPSGVAVDPEPVELASGANFALGAPAVAWNGSVYLLTWAENGTVLARRMAPDGTLLDPAPIPVMAGSTPDVHALGELFLVVGTHASNPQFRFPYAARVDGEGNVLDTPPLLIGQYFAQRPKVSAFSDRWVVVWQRNFSHDDHHSEVKINFLFPDGTQSGAVSSFIQGGLPDVAVADTLALVTYRSGSPASANNDVYGMRVTPTGQLLDDPLFGFTISAATGKQLDPAVVWTGGEFLVAWHDMRNQDAFFDQRTDVYAARVDTGGAVLDPSGFPVVVQASPAIQPALATDGAGATLAAVALFRDGAPHASYRIGTTRIDDPCSAFTAYCTAGITAGGCHALITATGTPSASAGSGFTLSVDGVDGQRMGILFYGLSGRKALPWGSGSPSYLCVQGPVQRTPVQGSGGTAGACDGSYSLDWNAYLVGKPNALGSPFAGGEVVNAQSWFRDPPSPKSTSLSNALEFTVCP